MQARTVALTAATLVAFAANSVLCRLALRPNLIDPISFALVRFGSGAIVLALIAMKRPHPRGSIKSGLVLFAYALPFSLAYVRLDAAVGALILFASVQLSMFGIAIANGEHPSGAEWLGLLISAAGIVWLNAPGLTAPDPLGAAMMAGAGIAWGAYSVLGRGATDAIASTRSNFLWVVPLLVAAEAITYASSDVHASFEGLGFALGSGIVASGLGYVVWYWALRGLSAAQAAVAQLAVPVIAAAGGVLLLGEQLSTRFLLCALVILGGVAIALFARFRARPL
jgi:drug/metabolite transporter (DMT)-like permease